MILFPTGIEITESVFKTPEECGTLIHFVNENSLLPGRKSWMRGLRM